MDGYWFNLALVAFLILVNALFAGSEIALISLREGQLRQLERSGGRTARVLLRLTRDPNRFLAAIQLAITLSGALASATAAVTLAQPLIPALGFAGDAAGPLAVALVTLVLTFFTLVFGELAPKRLAMQYAHRWAMLVARPLDLIATIARPAIWALSQSTNVVVRLFGGNPDAGSEQLSPEELRDLVVGHRGLNAEQRMIITGALEIHERLLRHVLVPRRSVVVIPADATPQEARTILAESGHSRAPVVRSGHLDDVAGLVHLRDLLEDGATVLERTRPATIFPDTLRVSDALRQFKATHQQFALVVDERGAVDGIVTLEDLLEEIVGEIYDETDRDILSVQTDEDGTLLLPGTFPVHDLVDLGVELTDAPAGDYTTIAGLALIALRRIPDKAGDKVELADWTIEVTAVDRHAITAVRLRPKRKPAED
nr:hemolysin family protein [Crossiella equi]